MASPPPSYYRPYLPSDSELSDADSLASDDTWDIPPSPRPPNAVEEDLGLNNNRLDVPNFAEFARGLAADSSEIANASGPTLATTDQSLAYATNRLQARTVYAPYGMTDVSGSIITRLTDVETVIVLQSRDRDRSIFPLPTSCQLFLPRIYKNIKAFAIAQINLTSAFFYFSEIKQNIAIQIYEQDRVYYEPTTTSITLDGAGSNIPLYITNYIRPGSYNIAQLLAEIQLQLNRTPLFYDFLNGFSDFYSQFRVTGDYSINFNFPGDTYYDSMNKTFIPNPTRESITLNYFSSQFAPQTTYTTSQVQVAYYYPVLKEALLDPTTNLADYNLSYPGYSDPQQVKTYIIYYFTGLNDPVVTQIIQQNFSQLDIYRSLHTFRYSLVNRYLCSYDPISNRVTIQSQSLNTSLVNLLNAEYEIFLASQLAIYNLTRQQYDELDALATAQLAVLQGMYDYMAAFLAKFFAINYGTFSVSYFGNLSNYILVRDGFDAQNVISNFNPAYSSDPRSNDLLDDLSPLPTYWWTNMKNLNATNGSVLGPPTNMGAPSGNFPTTSNFPYSLASSNLDTSQPFINLNEIIYTDDRRKAGDIVVDVEAGKYTIMKFRSRFRQTIQIESLPRQTNFRYPLWNTSNLDNPTTIQLFDASYSYITPSPAYFSNISYPIFFNNLYGWSNVAGTTSNYDISFSQSSNYWGTNFETIDIQDTQGKFYFFQTPLPTGYSNGEIYRYPITLTIQPASGTTFNDDLVAFIYHDIAAFYGDVSGVRNENPYFYKYSLILSSNAATMSNTISFLTYPNQTYYIRVRGSNVAFDATQYRIIPYFNPPTPYETLQQSTNFDPLADPSGQLDNWNVAQNNDPAWIRLPVQASLYNVKEPPQDPINQGILVTPPVIGYDSNSVSNDMTDYFPFVVNSAGRPIYPPAQLRFDPTNNYVFQSNSPYSQAAQSYFYPGSSNQLFNPQAIQKYTWRGGNMRIYKIVHPYSSHYIQDPQQGAPYAPGVISSNILPYTTATTSNTALTGYQYTALSNSLSLGTGVTGWTFLPSDGLYNINRIVFKTNFLNGPTDPNLNGPQAVRALGVFYTSDIVGLPAESIKLTDALSICFFQAASRYPNSNSLNLGFDGGLGTYYVFSNYASLPQHSNYSITGYTQNAGKLITNSNSFYSVIAFGGVNLFSNASLSDLSNAYVTYIRNLTGSPIPYPYSSNTAYPSSTFYDGTPSPDGNDMVLSTDNPDSIFGPTLGVPTSVSQYCQSQPIVNSHLHYMVPEDIVKDLSGYSAWSNVPAATNALVTTIPKSMMFQTGNYIIYPYYVHNEVLSNSTPPRRNFITTSPITFTPTDIFAAGENTQIIGVTGNSTDYCFLGSSNGYLRFKLYNLASNTLTELPTNSNYTFDATTNLLQHFVFHNTQRWFITYYNPGSNSITIAGADSYTTSNTMLTRTISSASNSELAMDPSGSNLYFATGDTFSELQLYSFDMSDPTGYVGASNFNNGYTIYLNTTSTPGVLSNYKQFAVTLIEGIEEVLLTNTDVSGYNYFKIEDYQQIPFTSIPSSNTTIAASIQTLPAIPSRIYGGGAGSTWLLFPGAPEVMGNRNDAYDSPNIFNTAWQIFFPTVKIEMTKKEQNYSAITDLSNIQYPEYPHTNIFAYSNLSTLSADISANNGQWGLESNFFVSDVSFNGFYFNSYMAIPADILVGEQDWYIALRGYSPTENFQTMLRFVLPKRYDFGYIRLEQLQQEIDLCQTSAASNFNPTYIAALLSFNSNFIFSATFGSNAATGYPGITINSTGIGDFLTQYSNLYALYNSNFTVLQTIDSNVNQLLDNFILNDLQYILPSNALNRQRYTDPILFQIRWETQLSPQFMTLEDEWGLGWNLGYAKVNTPFSTVQTGDSFYKIQQDYIYLRLNPEFNINRMDAGGKEDYKVTREPTGITNQYYCKLLLTSFGGNATTFIHNPITFNPPINRLTKLSFQWIFPNGQVIDNADAEWDMTVNITESTEIPLIPDKMAFTPADPRTGQPAPLPAGFQDPKAQEIGEYRAAKEQEELEAEKEALRRAYEQKLRQS